MERSVGQGSGSPGMRARWAAIGAAVAVALGAGAGIGLVGATSSPPSSFVAVAPVRILDTRTGLGLSGPFVSAQPRNLKVTGSVPTAGGSSATVVPAGATAVSFNVTSVGPTAAGFISVRPSGTPGAPSTSSLNVEAGAIVPNAVTVALPASGRVEIVYDAYGVAGPATHVLIDVVGYHVAGGAGGGGATGPAGPAGPAGPPGPGLSGPLDAPRAAFTTRQGVGIAGGWVTIVEHPVSIPTASCPAGTTPTHQVSVMADGTLTAGTAGTNLFMSVDVALALDDPTAVVAGTLTEVAARSADTVAIGRRSREAFTTQYLFEFPGSGTTRTVFLLGRISAITSVQASAVNTRVRSVHEGYTCN